MELKQNSLPNLKDVGTLSSANILCYLSRNGNIPSLSPFPLYYPLSSLSPPSITTHSCCHNFIIIQSELHVSLVSFYLLQENVVKQRKDPLKARYVYSDIMLKLFYLLLVRCGGVGPIHLEIITFFICFLDYQGSLWNWSRRNTWSRLRPSCLHLGQRQHRTLCFELFNLNQSPPRVSMLPS